MAPAWPARMSGELLSRIQMLSGQLQSVVLLTFTIACLLNPLEPASWASTSVLLHASNGIWHWTLCNSFLTPLCRHSFTHCIQPCHHHGL